MVTLLELKTRARQRADMVNNNFIKDDELTQYINASVQELHDLLIGAYSSDYFIKTYDFATIASTDSYALPADFYKLKGVDIAMAGGHKYSARPFNFNERNRNEIVSWGLINGPSIRYRIVGDDLVFSPAPDAAYSCTLWYIPTATPLVLDADTYSDVAYSEYVVIDVAIKMLQKQETDVSGLSQQKNQMLKRIEAMAQNRDVDHPESVSDIYAENDEFWFWRT